jgi:hypothetical protein
MVGKPRGGQAPWEGPATKLFRAGLKEGQSSASKRKTPRQRSIFWLSFDFTESKSVGNHFYIDVGSGWYAHGDRIKAASSAGSWQDRHLEHHLRLGVHDLELG